MNIDKYKSIGAKISDEVEGGAGPASSAVPSSARPIAPQRGARSHSEKELCLDDKRLFFRPGT
jgi:hypothetical protein